MTESEKWIVSQASMLELDFLREVDAIGDLYTKEVVHRAVYRLDTMVIILLCTWWYWQEGES